MSTKDRGGGYVRTLDEFLSTTRGKLDAFEKNWCEQVPSGNDNFPMSLPLVDWDEQLALFCSDED